MKQKQGWGPPHGSVTRPRLQPKDWHTGHWAHAAGGGGGAPPGCGHLSKPHESPLAQPAQHLACKFGGPGLCQGRKPSPQLMRWSLGHLPMQPGLILRLHRRGHPCHCAWPLSLETEHVPVPSSLTRELQSPLPPSPCSLLGTFANSVARVPETLVAGYGCDRGSTGTAESGAALALGPCPSSALLPRYPLRGASGRKYSAAPPHGASP